MEPQLDLETITLTIQRLEEERAAIYSDDQVIGEEHERLRQIEHELAIMWDQRRRLDAAHSAGLESPPVPIADSPQDPPRYPADGSLLRDDQQAEAGR